MHKTPHFAIVLDGVKKDVFPEVFRRRIRSLYYQDMQKTPHITIVLDGVKKNELPEVCLLYTSPSPRDS